MKVSTKGLLAIMSHEGIVTSRYKDSVGVWTIGVGHTKAAGGINPETFKGQITVAQAVDLFREDIAKYEKGVNAALKVPVAQHEFDALVSFHHNTGAIGKATLTADLNKGDHTKAGAGFMNWVKPPEIKGRRQSEQTLFLKGVYPAPYVNIYPASANGAVLWGKGQRVNADFLIDPVVVDAPAEKPVEPPKKTGFFASLFAKWRA